MRQTIIRDLKTWTFQDKTTWGPGPWQSEPDKAQWVDVPTGLPCLAVRQMTFGHWCGYVGVAKGHPLYRRDWKAKRNQDVFDELPNRVNFSGPCAPHKRLPPPEAFTPQFRAKFGVPWYIPSEERKYVSDIFICHTAAAGEKVWWIGFDLGHAFDFMPARDPLMLQIDKTFAAQMKATNQRLTERFDELKTRLGMSLLGDVFGPGTYKPIEYVHACCHDLASALSAMETTHVATTTYAIRNKHK